MVGFKIGRFKIFGSLCKQIVGRYIVGYRDRLVGERGQHTRFVLIKVGVFYIGNQRGGGRNHVSVCLLVVCVLAFFPTMYMYIAGSRSGSISRQLFTIFSLSFPSRYIQRTSDSVAVQLRVVSAIVGLDGQHSRCQRFCSQCE